MTPYATFYFFIIVAVLLTPTIIAGLKGKALHTYNAFATIVILAIVFGNKPVQAGTLI
jgi:membrane protein involved in D-alanine export